jgi:hypothetical protein
MTGVALLVAQYLHINSSISIWHKLHMEELLLWQQNETCSTQYACFYISRRCDLAAIGTAEIVHAANRGEHMTVFFVNNANIWYDGRTNGSYLLCPI